MTRSNLRYGYVTPQNIAHRTLIYGAPASGKTSIAASANTSPIWGPVLFINIDEGLSAVSHVPNLREVKAHEAADFNAIMNELTLPEDKKDPFFAPVKTIVFDSLSAARDELLIEFTAIQQRKGRREDAWTPEWKDFGKIVNFFTDKLNELRALGLHVVVLAGEAPIIQGDMQIGVQPNLNAKLLTNVNYGLSHIWRAEIEPKTGRYRLQVGHRPGGVLTKNRNPAFTKALIDLTINQAKERGEQDPNKSGNLWYISSPDNPTLSTLYDLYLSSGGAAADKSDQS